MSARKDLIESIESALNFNKDGAEKFFDKVVSAIKEEIIPKDQTYKEFFGLDDKPQLIQGYTAEQWQEIIDGGYLCEFGIVGDLTSSRFGILKTIEGSTYIDEKGLAWVNCRPAQIKGVMRPIFVEPVDKQAYCHFFDDKTHHICETTWVTRDEYIELAHMTKYIEL